MQRFSFALRAEPVYELVHWLKAHELPSRMNAYKNQAAQYLQCLRAPPSDRSDSPGAYIHASLAFKNLPAQVQGRGVNGANMFASAIMAMCCLDAEPKHVHNNNACYSHDLSSSHVDGLRFRHICLRCYSKTVKPKLIRRMPICWETAPTCTNVFPKGRGPLFKITRAVFFTNL